MEGGSLQSTHYNYSSSSSSSSSCCHVPGNPHKLVPSKVTIASQFKCQHTAIGSWPWDLVQQSSVVAVPNSGSISNAGKHR